MEATQEKLVPSSRPRVDADLGIIQKHYVTPVLDPSVEVPFSDKVTLAQLNEWNRVGGIRDLARIHGILNADQNATLYRALVTYHSQRIVVREATLRVMRMLQGCQRRIRMRGDVALPSEVRKGAALPGLSWGNYAGS
ncbi:MAG: hypothetical protein HY421_02650 [Candidatus Kerfeldbacteria bacterium]|nr:hypothetical protein [Candidatus Kerfeldbacteria bacterium]